MAENILLPEQILFILARDENPYVSMRALEHSNRNSLCLFAVVSLLLHRNRVIGSSYVDLRGFSWGQRLPLEQRRLLSP